MSTIYRTDKSKGNFTIISNDLLRDKDLSPQARFLLCLMLSLPEDWKYTASRLASISGAGISVVKTALRELEKRGYLIRRRSRSSDGRLGNAEYDIFEHPFNTGSKPDHVSESQKPLQADSIQVSPILEKPTLLKKEKTNTKDHTNTDWIDRAPHVNRVRIEERIDYDALVEKYGIQRVNEIVEIIVDTVISDDPICRIGKSEISRDRVRKRFKLLDYRHVKYVFTYFDETSSKISNIRSYLITALYNAPTTIDHYYDAQFRHDYYSG